MIIEGSYYRVYMGITFAYSLLSQQVVCRPSFPGSGRGSRRRSDGAGIGVQRGSAS